MLDEDVYTDNIEAIIERDYFPDLPKLRNKLDWLEAVRSGAPPPLSLPTRQSHDDPPPRRGPGQHSSCADPHPGTGPLPAPGRGAAPSAAERPLPRPSQERQFAQTPAGAGSVGTPSMGTPLSGGSLSATPARCAHACAAVPEGWQTRPQSARMRGASSAAGATRRKRRPGSLPPPRRRGGCPRRRVGPRRTGCRWTPSWRVRRLQAAAPCGWPRSLCTPQRLLRPSPAAPRPPPLAVQATYTSEDNASFCALVERTNARRTESAISRYALQSQQGQLAQRAMLLEEAGLPPPPQRPWEQGAPASRLA